MQTFLRAIKMGDYIAPPVLHSVLFWRDVIDGKVKEYQKIGELFKAKGISINSEPMDYDDFLQNINRGTCPYCDGNGTREEEQFGYYYCICWLLCYRQELYWNNRTYGSLWEPMNHETLQTVVSNKKDDNTRFVTALDTVDKWMIDPTRWLVLSGETGTGKTHMLSSMMRVWQPWSLYIVASDFEKRMRKYLAENSGQIGVLVETMKHHPILIIDDLGLEYERAPWIAAELDGILEFRSRDAIVWDKTTVIGTNIYWDIAKEVFSRQGIPRTASRLSNKKYVTWLPFTGVDFRRRAI